MRPPKRPSRLSVDSTMRPSERVAAGHPGVAPDRGHPERVANEHGDIARGRDVARLVEPVRIAVVRPPEAELGGLPVHERHEASLAPARRDRQGGRRVVGARHEGPDEEIADGDALAGTEIERRLSDPCRDGRHGDHVVEREVLERDEGCHQLRDARHRPRLVGAPCCERVAVDRALHEVRLRLHGRSGRALGGRGDGENGDRERETEAHRAGRGSSTLRARSAGDAHHPAAPQTAADSRAASAPAAARQSSGGASRYA